MDSKTTYTSLGLQEAFSDVYEQFFLKHNLIVSLPHVMHRGHSITKNNMSFKIKQKIPTRMYAGVNLLLDNDIVRINDFTYFSHLKNQFKTIPLRHISDKHQLLEKIIATKLKEFGFSYGLEINILSEHERGHGTSFSGILNTLLALVISIASDRLNIQKLSSYDDFFSSPDCQNIINLSTEIDTFVGGNPTGITSYTALSKNWEPVVGLGEDKKDRLSSLSTLLHIPPLSNFPIDYGIIYYGLPYDGTHIEGFYKNRINDYKNILSYEEQLYGEETSSKKAFSDPFKQISFYLTTKLLYDLEKLLKNPYQEKNVDDFISTISEHGIFNCFIEQEKDLWVATNYLFQKIKSFSDEKIGLTPASSGRTGGCFLFITKHQKSRESMTKLLDALKKEGYTNVSYEYLSRRDGFSYEGIRIEQFLDQKIYSPYIQEGSVLFETTNGISYIGDHRAIIEKENNSILLDTIDKKIYIKGIKLTHKDLCSQSGTIEVLQILLRNLGKSVTNKRLPDSSYSKNKNDMVGKIILPLQDLTEKHFGEKLPIKCNGSLYEYDIVLENTPIEIGFIKKIGNNT